MGKGFNGSTVTFASASLGILTDLTHNQTTAEIQIGGSTSAGYEYEPGLTDESVELTIQGGTTAVSNGSTGAVAVTWNDGTSASITKGVVTSITQSGSLDAPITTSITIRPRST